MKDKVVFITGAARGLGAGLAQKVVENGGSAFVVDLDAKAVEARVLALGDSADGCAGDVRYLDDMKRAMQLCIDSFGRIDVVVANAGILRMGSIEKMDPKDFQMTLDVNVTGAFNTIRAAVPHLRASKGYLQVVSSLAAAIHTPLMSHYAASKAAVEALADVARQELALDGIGVGCVHPTFTKTTMIEEAKPGQLWGGHKGAFAAIEPEQVVEAMYEAIVKRKRKTIVPKPIAPLVLAPGLFHWAAERISKMEGSDKAIRAFQSTEHNDE